MHRLIPILIISAFCLPSAFCEDIAALRERLVTAGIVQGTSTPTPVGAGETFTIGEDQVTVNELSMPVIVTTNDATPPALRKTSMLITVYDYQGPNEAAHVTDTRVRNYVSAYSPAQLLDRGQTALDGMIAAGVPVPAAPGDTAIGYLNMKCTHGPWVGQTITKYAKATIRQKDDVRGIYLYVYLSNGDRERAWIRVNDDNVFIVSPWE